MWIALAISIVTLLLVVVRPKPLNEATAAAIGAVLMVAAGQVSPPQTLEVLRGNINVLLFFLGLMVVSAVAEQAGFFQWGATKAVRLARGNGRALYFIVFLLGTAITAFLSNDATALVLTPVIYALAMQLRVNPLPFMFATGFIANTASSLLPISNPVNLLAVDTFNLSLKDYLRNLLIPSLATIAINVGIFYLIFRRDIPRAFMPDTVPQPIRKDGFFRFTGIVMAITAMAYMALSIYSLPLSLAALGGAVCLAGGGVAMKRVDWKAARSRISWSILVFIFCLAVVVKGLENSGVIRSIAELLIRLASGSQLATIVSVTVVTALGSNLVNNWSMMMVAVSSLQDAASINGIHAGAPYAAILGADVGPNLTIIGSLSSMLWLIILRQRGLNIRPLDYLKLGAVIVPPMLAAGALLIYVAEVFP